MGAINNAFNQAAGATAGAALAIKHAKETDFSKAITAENAALVARNQARSSDVAENTAEAEEDQANKDYIRSIVESWGKEAQYDKAKERKNASAKTVNKKLEEWEAAEVARKKLGSKVYSIDKMHMSAAEQRDHAAKATELAEQAQQKYQSKWGGK